MERLDLEEFAVMVHGMVHAASIDPDRNQNVLATTERCLRSVARY